MIKPQPGPQEAFLATPADIAIYGGAAGGGKTWALLMEPLRHVGNPRFGGVIFRRTSPQITNEGGLWDESVNLYPYAGARAFIGSLDWRWPSGANVGFRHLQHESNIYDWQGSQLAYLGFDELSHFTQNQFFYLISRLRSPSGVRPYVRATTNPDPGWVKTFLVQWVQKGHPDPARSGELRWFVRPKGELVWAHTRAELVAKYPGLIPRSVTFIRATVFDNKILLARNPEYLGNLQAQSPYERARLLDGDWDAIREGLVIGGLLERLCEPGDVPAAGFKSRIGGIDFGFNDPFCALGSGVVDDVLWVGFERYESFVTLPGHSAHLPRDGTSWWADPSRPESIAELRINGHDVRPCTHKGTSPVLEGIDRVTERIRTDRIRVSRSCQNLIREAGLYVYDKDGITPVDKNNHAPDALRYLVTGQDRGRLIGPHRKPEPTAEEQAAAERAEAEAKRAKRAEYMDPDADHWYGG